MPKIPPGEECVGAEAIIRACVRCTVYYGIPVFVMRVARYPTVETFMYWIMCQGYNKYLTIYFM